MIDTYGFTKNFAISKLIENVTIPEAICYLIDNAIDSAEKDKKQRNNIEYKIIIKYENNRLCIKDNCLGISRKEADNSLLRIGEKVSFDDKHGQGLKKAMFVLGNHIFINSVQEEKINIEIKITNNDENKLWDVKPSIEDKSDNDHKGFSIEFFELNKEVTKYLDTKRKSDELIDRVKYKYRYLIELGYISIEFNNEILKPLFIEAEKVAEEEMEFKEGKAKVILYNNIKNKDNNGVDFIVNDRIIVEKEKGSTINWNKRIRATGHTYRNFFAEVIIESNDTQSLGVNASNNKINFNTVLFQKIINFMHNVIENNRISYKKSFISVQIEIEKESLNEWKKILEENGEIYEFAKEIIEKLYIIGVNKIKEDRNLYK